MIKEIKIMAWAEPVAEREKLREINTKAFINFYYFPLFFRSRAQE